MATISLVDTAFSAKDVHTVLSVYEYTVPAGGVYKLRFQVRLVVAGNGVYTVYLHLNDGDALTDDPIEPKTLVVAASGETKFWCPTISIDANTGDVFNVMVLGLAADTSISGSIRIYADDAVGVTTYGNTLDVSATGEAGVDLTNIKQASSPTTLTNITVPTVTTLTNAPANGMVLP